MNTNNQTSSASFPEDTNQYQSDNNFNTKLNVNSSSKKTNSTSSNLQEKIKEEFTSDEDFNYDKIKYFYKKLSNKKDKSDFSKICLEKQLYKLGGTNE